ncbi:MAG: hypothetical protein IJW79_10425 [Clostridia bacterium]|nr:hypothetical protein [Clostridia bacterium]
MTYTNAEKMILTAPAALSGGCLDQILNRLGSPEKNLKIIKIFGECGKSSVCSLLSATLSASAYKVGHVVTPFIHSVRNCVRIYERPISIELFSKSAEKVYKAVGVIKKEKEDTEEFTPSRSDLLFATAICAFYDSGCDAAIIELPPTDTSHTFLGKATVTVISSVYDPKIAFDICTHMDRDSGEVVSAIQERDVHKIIFDKCAELQIRFSTPLKSAFCFSSISVKRMEFTYKTKLFTIGCGAYYQIKNLLTVLEAVEALRRSSFRINGTDICSAILSEGLPLRFESISVMPNVIIDRADNSTRRKALIDTITKLKDYLSSPPFVVCESECEKIREEFEAEYPDTKVFEVDSKIAKKSLKPLISSIAEENTVIVLGTSDYCEQMSKITKEILCRN